MSVLEELSDWLNLIRRGILLRLRLRAPRLVGVLNLPERRRRTWALQHRAGRRSLTSGVIAPDKLPTPEDVAIAKRLLDAYAAAVADAPPEARPTDQWTFVRAQQDRFVSVLERGDPAELAAYMCNAARHDATNGMLQGVNDYERIVADGTYRRWIALSTRDKLVSLAETVGATPVENPEDGELGKSLRGDPALLVERIEQRLGIEIAPPDVDGGLFTIDTARGRFCERDLWGIFTAHLLARTLEQEPSSNGRGPMRICEIGGGSGRAAYWGQRLGLGPYTIVDLPHVNVVHGWYLCKTLPREHVQLYGEDGPADRVRVLPDHSIARADAHDYDLVLNQDSFPELSAEIVGDYLAWIKRVCAGGLLLSVNHESKSPYGRFDQRLSHICVPEVVEQAGGFERRQRYPCWLRRGYVVELYRVQAADAAA